MEKVLLASMVLVLTAIPATAGMVYDVEQGRYKQYLGMDSYDYGYGGNGGNGGNSYNYYLPPPVIVAPYRNTPYTVGGPPDCQTWAARPDWGCY